MAAAQRLVLASNNVKKLAELQALLRGLPVTLVRQGELQIPEAPEPHPSFIENALAKARHAAALAQGPALADDSGLCVDALGGAPGVISAHFADLSHALAATLLADREARRAAQDQANNSLLLQRLHGALDRRAAFVCTLVAVRHAQDPEPLVAVGRWQGEVLLAARGEFGFGYDPLMYFAAQGCSGAEMPAAVKNQHSHRALAMGQLLGLLRTVWRW